MKENQQPIGTLVEPTVTAPVLQKRGAAAAAQKAPSAVTLDEVRKPMTCSLCSGLVSSLTHNLRIPLPRACMFRCWHICPVAGDQQPKLWMFLPIPLDSTQPLTRSGLEACFHCTVHSQALLLCSHFCWLQMLMWVCSYPSLGITGTCNPESDAPACQL